MGEPGEQAFVVVAPGTEHERRVPLADRLVIGRECAGVAESRRLVIDDPAISRHHLELRAERGEFHAVDVSANGTLLNGARMDRGVRIPLGAGDRIELGGQVLRFDTGAGAATFESLRKSTARLMTTGPTAMVVGDIVGYSAISTVNDSRAVTEALETLFGELRELLRAHGGMLANYAGDAFFGAWELRAFQTAGDQAVAFARAAAARVQEIAPKLDLRIPHGEALRMGWGVASGDATISVLTGALTTVIGDAANVAFLLSGIAGREGRPPILVLDELLEALEAPVDAGEPESVEIKGREEPVVVRSVTIAAGG